ncbi:MAG: hypothetical protein HUJ76_05510, partial [Parasporobacterium sp.]|nr:hypothetical protein [Parasporobacterium sp.]
MKQKIIGASSYGQFISDSKKLRAYMADIGAHDYYFSIYSTALDDEKIWKVCAWIEEQFPGADYYGCTSFANIINGQSSSDRIAVICTIAESASTRFKIMHYDSTKTPIEDFAEYLYKYIDQNSWIKAAEFIVASSLKHSRNVICEVASR